MGAESASRFGASLLVEQLPWDHLLQEGWERKQEGWELTREGWFLVLICLCLTALSVMRSLVETLHDVVGYSLHDPAGSLHATCISP